MIRRLTSCIPTLAKHRLHPVSWAPLPTSSCSTPCALPTGSQPTYTQSSLPWYPTKRSPQRRLGLPLLEMVVVVVARALLLLLLLLLLVAWVAVLVGWVL